MQSRPNIPHLFHQIHRICAQWLHMVYDHPTAVEIYANLDFRDLLDDHPCKQIHFHPNIRSSRSMRIERK